MAKQDTDRTTIDLFAQDKRAGRPKTSLLSRKDQLKANKRKQLQRDRDMGVKRIELKVNGDLFEILNQLATNSGVSRSEFIAQFLDEQLMQTPSNV